MDNSAVLDVSCSDVRNSIGHVRSGLHDAVSYNRTLANHLGKMPDRPPLRVRHRVAEQVQEGWGSLPERSRERVGVIF